MKEIKLSNGMKTIVDDDVFEWASKLKWSATKSGKKYYAIRNIKNKNNYTHISLHRVINNTPDGFLTDHINRDTLDNRRENLRTVTSRQNVMNRGCHCDGAINYKGVFLFKGNGKYIAQIKPNGTIIHLGYYDTPEEAAKIYDESALKYFGEFAYLNFPLDKQE